MSVHAKYAECGNELSCRAAPHMSRRTHLCARAVHSNLDTAKYEKSATNNHVVTSARRWYMHIPASTGHLLDLMCIATGGAIKMHNPYARCLTLVRVRGPSPTTGRTKLLPKLGSNAAWCLGATPMGPLL